MTDSEYVAEVLAKLQDNPTAQDLDYFIEAYARVGYLAATARGRAEYAESAYKHARATAYADAKATGRAKTAADAEQAAIVDAYESEQRAIRAREAASKVANLLSSVEQAINGIKYLGRQTDAPMQLPRTR